ncbi:hypothetical protein pb186bvf_010388 [Paramecium bursaria]
MIQAQAFTFGADSFQPPKHPQISKLSPFYKITKPQTQQRSRLKSQNDIPRIMMQTLQRNVESRELRESRGNEIREYLNPKEFHNKENRNGSNQYISLDCSKHKKNPSEVVIARLETSPDHSGIFKEKKPFRRLSYNGTKNLPSMKSFDLEPIEKYKQIAIQLKQLFLRQQKLYQNGGNPAQLEQLQFQFEQLCTYL